MPDLLEFEKIEVVPNDKAKIREARANIVKALIHNIYADAFIKSVSFGDRVKVYCKISIVDYDHWSQIIESAYSDRKSLEYLMNCFNSVCFKLNIDASKFDNFNDLADQVLKKIE